MRVFAIHDAAGNISELVTCPDDLPRVFLRTDPPLSMTEIEIPTDLSAAELESPEGVTKLMQNYRVEVITGKPARALARSD